jgi:prevent-host-death family protein
MTTIGVREFKAKLSEQLRRVQAGERLVITDRGRPIATIGPVEATERPAWVTQMVAEGLAHYGGGKPIGLSPRIKSKGLLASTAVIEDRR